MRNNEKKNKHMTLDDRIEIQECLSKGMTFKAIGKRIGKTKQPFHEKSSSIDNGGEFSIVSDFENDIHKNKESDLFFCEPASPHEKTEIEKNHTLFRDIVPSGTSFDEFDQDTVNLIFSHANAVKRKQFNGKSAYDMFSFYYSDALASALGISFVPANQVVQSPKLFAKSFS